LRHLQGYTLLRKFNLKTSNILVLRSLDHDLVCMGSRLCTCLFGVSIMYLCVWGLDHELVCMGSRSCTCVYGVSIMYYTHKYMIETPYTQVHDRDPIHTSTWSRPNTHKYMIETQYTQVYDRTLSWFKVHYCFTFM
jgi:hypothetical protein